MFVLKTRWVVYDKLGYAQKTGNDRITGRWLHPVHRLIGNRSELHDVANILPRNRGYSTRCIVARIEAFGQELAHDSSRTGQSGER